MLNLSKAEKVNKELTTFKQKINELDEPKKSEAESLYKQLEHELDLMNKQHGGGLGYLDYQTMKDIREKSVRLRRQLYYLLKLH